MKPQKKEPSVANFGKRLRAIRELANVSQEQIHYALGISQMHISRIESGDINTTIGNASRIAGFFGLQDYELFQYDAALPAKELLQKNILRYLTRNNIDPNTFLKKGLTYLIRAEILSTKFLNTPRQAAEIREYIQERFGVQFSTSRISDTLEELKKKGLIEKCPTDKKSKFQYRKSDKID